MKTLCTLLLLAAISGMVHLTTSTTIIQNTTDALFFASLGLITLNSLRQPKLSRVAARK